MKTQTRGWPESRRKAQAERIKQQKPWLHATGPRTTEGKEKTRLNSVKHNMRSAAMLRLRRALARQRFYMKTFAYLPSPMGRGTEARCAAPKPQVGEGVRCKMFSTLRPHHGD